MSNMIAHALMVVVAGIVVLAAAVTRNRVDDLAIATTRVRAEKKLTLDVAAALERDMRNIGSNFPTYDLEPDSAVVSWKTDSSLNFFQFMGQIRPGESPAVIRYEWSIADSVTVGDEVKPAYRISRYVDGVLSRVSAAVFTGVSFDVQNDLGQPATTADEVRQVSIELLAVSGIGSSSALHETRWNAVYRPQAIARNDGEIL
jgi:hypothetical protein